MNALNEVNKVITNVSYTPHRHIDQDEEYLTPEKMAVSYSYLSKKLVTHIKDFFFLILISKYRKLDDKKKKLYFFLILLITTFFFFT